MRACCWILLSSLFAAPALAQETRGNISGTVRDAQGVVPGATVTITGTDGFQTRAFPFQVDGLRGPGLTYVNMNLVRNFQLGGRRTFQARLDIQNLLNYAACNNPVTDPTNSNFGKVTTAVASAGAMRFFNFVMRSKAEEHGQ